MICRDRYEIYNGDISTALGPLSPSATLNSTASSSLSSASPDTPEMWKK